LEIQSAAITTNGTVGEKAATGGISPLGKSAAPSAAEMRSAFEAMMGSLLGMLGGGQQLLLPDAQPTANPSSTSPGLANTGENSDRPALDGGIFALNPGKTGRVVATPTSQALAAGTVANGAAAVDGQMTNPAVFTAVAGQQPILPTQTTSPAERSGVPVPPNGMPTTQEMTHAASPSPVVLPLPQPDANPVHMENGVANPLAPAAGQTNGVATGATLIVQATPAAQISGQVTAALAQGQEEIALALHPQELGMVHVTVQPKNGEVQLSLRADEAATGRLLTNALTDLRQKLEGQGIKVGQLTITQAERPHVADAGPVNSNNQPIAPVTGAVFMPAQPVSSTTKTPAEQISGQVTAALVQGEQEIVLALQPKELGTVRVEVQRQGGEVQISLRAEEVATGRLLANSLTDLRQKFEVQGFRVGELAVVQTERSPRVDAGPVNSNNQPIAPVTGAVSTPAQPADGQRSVAPPLAQITEQISEQVTAALVRGEGEVALAFQPQELGTVWVEVERQNGEVQLSLRAEEATTGRLLVNVLTDLRQKLEAQGAKVGELTVPQGERAYPANAGPVTGTLSTPAQPAAGQNSVPAPIEQISRQVTAALVQGEQEIAIALQPKELGVVRVAVQRESGEVGLTLRADEPATGHLLTNVLGELRQKLETQGFKVGALAVTQRERPLPAEASGRDATTVLRSGSADVSSQQIASSGGATFAVGLNVSGATVSTASIASAQASVVGGTPAEQISERVQIALGRGEQETTIALHPKELGSVRIRMQMENGQLHLSIRAEEQSTGRLLTSRLADLRQSLEGQGIKVGELAVSRGERPLPVETLGREVAPAARSGQMDMNSNDTNAPRQQAGFTPGNFGGGNFAGGQNGQRQESGLGSHGLRPTDMRPGVDPRQSKPTTRGPAGVDYYA